MKHLMGLCTKYKYVLLVIILAFLASLPLFHSGLMPTHDGEYHLIRFYEFDKMLRAGYWYPRWAPDLNFGYGVPLFTYVYPLPNYIASLFHFFGASFLDSVKLNMMLATCVGALLMYGWAKKFWGSLGGLIASVLYTFSPYHFVDIYVRGSVGEVWALALFPGFLLMYTDYVKSKKPIHFTLAILFLAFTIFSHNIVGLMSFVFGLSYMLFILLLYKQKRALFFDSLWLIFLSLCLSSVFWLPALFETHLVTGLQVYNVQQNFTDLFQLLFPSWGTGFYGSSLNNQMSVQIGTANLIAVFLSFIALFVFTKKRMAKETKIILFFLAWFAVLIFLMLPASMVLWKNVPLMNYFQFPWRFLSLAILVCSFIGGSIVHIGKPRLTTILIVLFTIATTISYTYPAYYMMRSDTYYTSRSNFIDGTNSPGNVFNTVWGKSQAKRASSILLSTDVTNVKRVEKVSPAQYVIELATREKMLTTNLTYFPSWYVFVDGKISHTFEKQGLLSFNVKPGKHIILLYNDKTQLEKIASIISLLTCFFLLFLLLRKRIE